MELNDTLDPCEFSREWVPSQEEAVALSEDGGCFRPLELAGSVGDDDSLRNALLRTGADRGSTDGNYGITVVDSPLSLHLDDVAPHNSSDEDSSSSSYTDEDSSFVPPSPAVTPVKAKVKSRVQQLQAAKTPPRIPSQGEYAAPPAVQSLGPVLSSPARESEYGITPCLPSTPASPLAEPATPVTCKTPKHSAPTQGKDSPRSQLQIAPILRDLGPLGAGQFGEVRKAALTDGTIVAVKTLKETTETDTQEFLAEIKLITSLQRHTNVLQVLGGYRDRHTGQPILIMDYKEEGTLKDLITAMPKESRSFTPGQTYEIIRQVAAGLCSLHAQKVVHNDLAARNVLVERHHSGTIKCFITDFGLSLTLAGDKNYAQLSDHLWMPVKWNAPEAITLHKFSEKSDMWSFGILAIEVLTYDNPFPEIKSAVMAASKIATGEHPEIRPEWPLDYAQMLELCWRFDPAERISAAGVLKLLTREREALQHEWPLPPVFSQFDGKSKPKASVVPPSPAVRPKDAQLNYETARQKAKDGQWVEALELMQLVLSSPTAQKEPQKLAVIRKHVEELRQIIDDVGGGRYLKTDSFLLRDTREDLYIDKSLALKVQKGFYDAMTEPELRLLEFLWRRHADGGLICAADQRAEEILHTTIIFLFSLMYTNCRCYVPRSKSASGKRRSGCPSHPLRILVMLQTDAEVDAWVEHAKAVKPSDSILISTAEGGFHEHLKRYGRGALVFCTRRHLSEARKAHVLEALQGIKWHFQVVQCTGKYNKILAKSDRSNFVQNFSTLSPDAHRFLITDLEVSPATILSLSWLATYVPPMPEVAPLKKRTESARRQHEQETWGRSREFFFLPADFSPPDEAEAEAEAEPVEPTLPLLDITLNPDAENYGQYVGTRSPLKTSDLLNTRSDLDDIPVEKFPMAKKNKKRRAETDEPASPLTPSRTQEATPTLFRGDTRTVAKLPATPLHRDLSNVGTPAATPSFLDFSLAALEPSPRRTSLAKSRTTGDLAEDLSEQSTELLEDPPPQRTSSKRPEMRRSLSVPSVPLTLNDEDDKEQGRHLAANLKRISKRVTSRLGSLRDKIHKSSENLSTLQSIQSPTTFNRPGLGQSPTTVRHGTLRRKRLHTVGRGGSSYYFSGEEEKENPKEELGVSPRATLRTRECGRCSAEWQSAGAFRCPGCGCTCGLSMLACQCPSAGK